MNEQRVKELMNERRVSFYDDCNGVNRLNGLYDLIKKHFNENFEMVEIGSFEGKSTELFALNCKTVYSVDPYEAYPDIKYQYIQNAEKTIIELIKQYSNIIKIKKRSLEAVLDFKDYSLDAIYVDGAHDYNNVKNDIMSWFPKIKNNGIMCGHDFGAEVAKAVNEIFNNKLIFTYSDSSWAVVKEITYSENIKMD